MVPGRPGSRPRMTSLTTGARLNACAAQASDIFGQHPGVDVDEPARAREASMNTTELCETWMRARAARRFLLPLTLAGALSSVPAPAFAQAFTLPRGVGAVTLAF